MSIAVCYLSRKLDSESLLWEFVESYKRYETGCAHDLIIILKGYDNHDLSRVTERLKKTVICEQLVLEDVGFDITAYREAAIFLNHRWVYFLNSYSQIGCKFWLEKYVSKTIGNNVSLVGTTGSYQSRYSSEFWNISNEDITFDYLRRALRVLKLYSRFPNPHIRTNAFLVDRQKFLKVAEKYKFQSKDDCYEFESGRKGLTESIRREGASIFVVGRDGLGYDIMSWEKSNTFCSGKQQNLIISDNQSKDYENSSEDRQKYLTTLTFHELRNAFGLPVKERNYRFRISNFFCEFFCEFKELLYLASRKLR